jgi:hypothetical protein
MTPREISEAITNCLSNAYEFTTNKDKIDNAMETLLPLLGHLPDLKRVAEYNYAVACGEGAGGSKGSPERVRLKEIEAYAAKEKSELAEVNALEKSLHSALITLQSLKKE